MPVSKKRKTAATSGEHSENSTAPALTVIPTLVPQDTPPTTIAKPMEKAVNGAELASPGAMHPESADREHLRQERFKALQARAVSLIRSDVLYTVLFYGLVSKTTAVRTLMSWIEKVRSAKS